MILLIALVAALRLVSLGGGLYEVALVDRAWPKRPDIIRPKEGGIRRSLFWIPAHASFEVAAVIAIIVAWPNPAVRAWLVGSLAIHGLMRVWSFKSFIPQALAFEKGTRTLGYDQARRWVRASRLRLILDLASAGTAMAALLSASAAA